MDHNEAMNDNAAERYLLNEMAPGEQEAFEDHFFDCAECAADVRDGARMMAAGRAIGRDTAAVVPMRRKRGWVGWVPQAVAAAVVAGTMGWYGGVGSVGRVEPAPPAQIVQVQLYDLDTTRGEAPSEGPAKVQVPADIRFDVVAQEGQTPDHFEYSIRGSGKTWFSSRVTADQAMKPVVVHLPELPRGRYEVVIEGVTGGNRSSIAKSEFEVVGERRGV